MVSKYEASLENIPNAQKASVLDSKTW